MVSYCSNFSARTSLKFEQYGISKSLLLLEKQASKILDDLRVSILLNHPVRIHSK